MGVGQWWDGTCDPVREGITPRGLRNAGRWNLSCSHLQLVLMLRFMKGAKGGKIRREGEVDPEMKELGETDLMVEHCVV